MKILFLLLASVSAFGQVRVGADRLFEDPALLKGKRIGLISNHSAMTAKRCTIFDLLRKRQSEYHLIALFAPEHGFFGRAYANEEVHDQMLEGIPLYNLQTGCRRPTPEMLKGIDLLIFDVQDIGSRSYTYISTLFYCMEEAAKHDIPFVVLDRPNPMGGIIVDGPLLEEKYRSFLGYVNVPYCHGMTVGELSLLFNREYNVGCKLRVIKMEGWERQMSFADTELLWVPPSPQIPEADTPLYYPTTGMIGHCSLVSIGIGYTLPFKLIGAPWIDAEKLARVLNKQNLPGVFFQPFFYKPFFGKFKLEDCQGVAIMITEQNKFLPISTQYAVMGVLKSLYPQQFAQAMQKLMDSKVKSQVFNKLSGSDEILKIISKEKYISWKLREICERDRKRFLPIRKKYLLY